MRRKSFIIGLIIVCVVAVIGILVAVSYINPTGILGKWRKSTTEDVIYESRAFYENVFCKLRGGRVAGRYVGGLGSYERACLIELRVQTTDVGNKCFYDKECQGLCFGQRFPMDFDDTEPGRPGSCTAHTYKKIVY